MAKGGPEAKVAKPVRSLAALDVAAECLAAADLGQRDAARRTLDGLSGHGRAPTTLRAPQSTTAR